MAIPKLQLHTKILLAMVVGAAFGLLANRLAWGAFVATYIEPLGTAFVRLIGMVIVPLVFASLLVGTTSLGDIRSLGRIGAKTIGFYLCTTVIAITIGLLLANLVQPGLGLAENAKSRLIERAAQQDIAAEAPRESASIRDVLLNIIPTNPIRAFAEGQMLQIIFFSLLTGVCLTLIGAERGGPAIRFFEAVNDAMVMMVHLIMKAAPFGVFALLAAVVADFGLHILAVLAKYSAVVLAGLLVHMLLVYSLALRLFSKVGAGRFFRGIRPAQLIAFSSASSSATLPVTIECAVENLGVPRPISSFTLPLGATVNMDGTSLYQGVAAVFLAQLYGMDLSLAQQLTIVLTTTLASIGTAGTPGAGIVTLAVVLGSIGVPLEGIGIILGVDRILDMCRTVVNVTGDAVCAVVVASTENPVRRAPAGE